MISLDLLRMVLSRDLVVWISTCHMLWESPLARVWPKSLSHIPEIKVGQMPKVANLCRLCYIEVEPEEHYVCWCPKYYEIRGDTIAYLFRVVFGPLNLVIDYPNQRCLGLFLWTYIDIARDYYRHRTFNLTYSTYIHLLCVSFLLYQILHTSFHHIQPIICRLRFTRSWSSTHFIIVPGNQGFIFQMNHFSRAL